MPFESKHEEFVISTDPARLDIAAMHEYLTRSYWAAGIPKDEDYRGRGLGKWLMSVVLSHPDLQGLRRFGLITQDAHGLYEQFGFSRLKEPDRHMEIRNDPYSISAS